MSTNWPCLSVPDLKFWQRLNAKQCQSLYHISKAGISLIDQLMLWCELLDFIILELGVGNETEKKSTVLRQRQSITNGIMETFSCENVLQHVINQICLKWRATFLGSISRNYKHDISAQQLFVNIEYISVVSKGLSQQWAVMVNVMSNLTLF